MGPLDGILPPRQSVRQPDPALVLRLAFGQGYCRHSVEQHLICPDPGGCPPKA
jgi:hypothetical protein